MTLLRLRHGRVQYADGHEALRDADIAISAGQFTVLLGSSGAGKSTLLRALNGIVPLTEGGLEAQGIGRIDSAAKLRVLRRRTGMVFQQHQLMGRLSALANVLVGRLGYHASLRAFLPLPREDKRIALLALERVGLLEHALRRADQLSGGQQQRVGIARALAQQPRLVLADEPVASLDQVTAVRVLSLLHRICKADGIAAVVSLHQVELARHFADRVVGIAAGRTVFDGPPTALTPAALAHIYGSAAPAGEALLEPAALAA